MSARSVTPASPAPATRSAGTLAWALLLVAVGALVWWRAFSTWFAQDDFRWLLRAVEGTPFPPGPRVLSLSLYFRAMVALAGPQPNAFHAANVALHVTTGVLLFHVMVRRLPRPAAAIAAAAFLTSPALFDTLHWASAITDLLAGVFLALALWLLLGCAEATSRVRPWLAVGAFALALASKEIAVGAAPVLALLHWRWGQGRGAARALLTLALAGLCAWAASGSAVSTPYAMTPVAALHNLPGFVAAASIGGVAWAEPSDLVWTRSALAQAAGWTLLAVWLAGLLWRRSEPAWLGFAWFVTLLAPVLALERQVYFYYLYCALPGLVFSVAFLLAEVRAPMTRAVGWAAAALIVAQGAALEARATSRLAQAPLPTDFVLRRAVIARNAMADLAPAGAALRPRVVMLGQQPVEAAAGGVRTTEATDYTRDPWWDENVRGAVSDGEAVRLFHRQVRTVVFKPWPEPEDTASTIVAYRIDGHLEVADYAAFVGVRNLGAPATLAEHLERARSLILKRLFREALRELEAARLLAPDNPDVLVNLGVLQSTLGDNPAALATLTHAAEVLPHDREVLYNLGLVQWRMDRKAEARRTWDRLLAEAPDSDLARLVRELLAGRTR